MTRAPLWHHPDAVSPAPEPIAGEPTAPTLPTNRRRAGWSCVALATAVVILHAGLIAGRAHHRGEDDLELTIPYNVAFWHALDAGESPWWLPWIDGGTSTFARFPYLGPFYPAALFFRVLPPVRALELALLAHVLLAAFGMRAWLRAQGISERGAWLGGVVYAGASVWRVADREGYATEVPVWTWLPWALAAIEGARRESIARAGGLSGLAVGLVALGGHGTDLYVGLLMTTTYLLVRLAGLVNEPGSCTRMAGAALLAGAIGAGIGLAFWWPAFAILDPDVLGGARAAKPAIAHPLLRLVLPFRAWGTKESLYVGIVPLVCIVAALPRLPKRVLAPLALPALIALALSFGPGSAPWRALGFLPGLSLLDQGNVFSWPFAMFAAALAAHALDAPRMRDRWRRTTAAAVLFEALVYASPTWFAPVAIGQPGDTRRSLATEALPFPQTGLPRRVLPLAVRSPEGNVWPWRNDSLLTVGIEDVRASAHLGSPRLRRWLRAIGPWPVDWDSYSDDRARAPDRIDLGTTSVVTRVLDLLGVDVLLTDVRVEGDAFACSPGGDAPSICERREPLARYRLVPRATVIADENDARARLLAPEFDPRADVVLATAAPAAPSAGLLPRAAAPAAGRVEVARYLPGDIALDVEARAGETLVVAETFLAGWSASIDGEPVPLIRANDLHMALAPPAGRCRVELRYSPPRLGAGLAVAGSAVTLALALVVVPERGRNRRLVTES